jgi:hypothetical protein
MIGSMLSIERLYGAPAPLGGLSCQAKETVMADNKIQGEGDYISGKKYQEMQHEFAEKGPVKEKAREAEQALDGPEGAELEEARKETGAGKTR